MEDETNLKRIAEKLDLLIEGKKQKKEKTFKLPFSSKISNVRARKGWVTVCKINENREVTFTKKPIEEQTIELDEIPRIATPDEVLNYKGKPFIIVPSWSTKPFSPTDSYQTTIAQNYAAQGFRLLLNRMKKEAITAKKAISGWVIFIVIAAVIALGYFAYQGGLFK